MSEWNPNMDEAPKDGTVILAGRFGIERVNTCAVVMWDDGLGTLKDFPWGIVAADLDNACHTEFFTHWMPLPEPPK